MPGDVMLITGARKGIGRFLAEHYAGRGYRVVGCSRQAPDWTHPNCEHVAADVSREEDVKGLLSRIAGRYGRLDVILNNAGIASMNHFLLTPGNTAQRIMETNFTGTFLVCREGARLMMKHRRGRIVNFSTVAVPMTLEGEAVYAASKSAVETFTKVIARELAPCGITCNAVGPAPVETDLIRSVPPEKIRQLVDRLAIKRLGTFQDVANVIDFFIREESAYVTGQILYLGGA